jgi:hypothetical protein
MSDSPPSPGALARFDELIARLGTNPDVHVGTSWGGTPDLRVSSKIFAMLSRGELVLKLPRQRVDHIVAAGHGTRFDPRRNGRVMKEWVSVSDARLDGWPELADEALAFVRALATRSD